ncbi:MAG: preprotein translocase subunit SecY, partial [Candidatus Bathyarchaeota archaeon]
MAGRFLGMFSPISRFVPEVSPPQRSVSFNEKLFWTLMALAIYLIMTEIPLYGVPSGQGLELAALRVIFASNRGTLMELGIGPIVTAGLILQLLAGSGMIAVNFADTEDRSLFTTASKVFSVIMIGVQASAYLIGGVYGSLTPTVSLVIFIQLMVAGLVLMLLDELLQKGWGIGSGISLFILAGVAQSIMWSAIAPTPPMQDGKSSGAFIALVQTLMNREPLINAFIRVDVEGNALNLPTMLGFFTTIVVFLIVIYVEGVRVELPISYARYRGFRSRYPIKLLYVSNLPVIFASALFANVYLFSQLFWSQPWGRDNFWVSLLGRYETPPGG